MSVTQVVLGTSNLLNSNAYYGDRYFFHLPAKQDVNVSYLTV